MDELAQFRESFKMLTNNLPFPWQEVLYTQYFSQGTFPPSCNIPTGLGKTSVVAIWLIALAYHPKKTPRRLVYVVNRRTVVDQTTEEVLRYRQRIAELKDDDPLKHQLDSLAISTLRGQYADTREWSANPARPAVIIGTVDMIGSRLLFSGYGVGFKTKPLHAGFLGQDVLLVHDEAHLEPAFQTLIEKIVDEQKRCNELGRFHVMAMSATSRNGDDAFGLTADELAGKIEPVRQRIEARKTIHFHEIIDEKKSLADKVVELALRFEDSKRAILVFVRKVEDVEKIAKKLPSGRTQQLTGTLRGLERDKLVNDPIFRNFLPKGETLDRTVYLVCTSAGEVGVNLSADHLVCDLSTFESMAQRFGRVNRFGERTDTEIHVVHPAKFDTNDELDRRRGRTLDLLKQLTGNASPKALGELGATARMDAFAPPPVILPATDILFDAWALTTIRDALPGRPPVEPYLHGVSKWELPDTYIAWREEVEIINDDLAQEYDCQDLLDDYPLKPHELLRDRSDRVLDELEAIRRRKGDATSVWIEEDGRIQRTTLGNLIGDDRKAAVRRIAYCRVILPPSVGGLTDKGTLDGSLDYDPNHKTGYDVADKWFADKEQTVHRRIRVWKDDPDYAKKTKGMRLVREIVIQNSEDDDVEERIWRWFELPQSAENEGSKSAKAAVLLAVHTADVVRHATEIVQQLPLSKETQNAVILAARFHDIGKDRKVFQLILGNREADKPLAKSKKPLGVRDDYRHEFGSLLDAEDKLDGDMKDLVLHLIAAHHGRARPHFPTNEVFDPEPKGKDTGRIAAEVPRRFARLQRKYGRWGLAYLESLLRAADYAASANPSQVMKDQQ